MQLGYEDLALRGAQLGRGGRDPRNSAVATKVLSSDRLQQREPSIGHTCRLKGRLREADDREDVVFAGVVGIELGVRLLGVIHFPIEQQSIPRAGGIDIGETVGLSYALET